jgi:hypothetical protein
LQQQRCATTKIPRKQGYTHPRQKKEEEEEERNRKQRTIEMIKHSQQ